MAVVAKIDQTMLNHIIVGRVFIVEVNISSRLEIKANI